jgi:hypothetical protein
MMKPGAWAISTTGIETNETNKRHKRRPSLTEWLVATYLINFSPLSQEVVVWGV